MDCVTSEMHKFTIKQEKNSNISICGLDTNIKSPCIMCVQYIRDDQYIGGVQYIGGYHEYTGGCSVHRRDTKSTSGRGDIMSTLRDVHYIGGYHDACGGYREYIGDIMSTSGFSIEIERIYQVAPPHAS